MKIICCYYVLLNFDVVLTVPVFKLVKRPFEW